MVHLGETMLNRNIYAGSAPEIDTVIQQVHAFLSDLYTFEETGMDYLGALVGRFDLIVATPAGVTVPFQNDIIPPLHDKGDFWTVGDPTKLIIPVDGAGYYYCHASAQWQNGVSTAVLRLFNQSPTQLAIGSSPDTTINQVSCHAVMEFLDGNSLTCEVLNTGGNRNVDNGAFTPMSVVMGMYRVGLLP